MTANPSLPTTLISGYLGAGKSTLINYLLAESSGLRITVLVNDFGEIAIDEKLIKNRSGDTIALTNGCMCCSMGGALFDAIDRILKAEPRPDHLVIETSGVADPNKIAQIAIAEPELQFAGCITVVDCLNFLKLRDQKYLGDTVDRQVACADVLGITKSDLGNKDEIAELQETLLALAPDASCLTIDNGKLPFEFLLAEFRNRLPEQGSHGKSLLGAERDTHIHATIYESWSYSGNAQISLDTLRQISEPDRSGIYRLKGIVHNHSGNSFEVHRTGADFQFRPSARREKVTSIVAIGPAAQFSPERFETAWQLAVIDNVAV